MMGPAVGPVIVRGSAPLRAGVGRCPSVGVTVILSASRAMPVGRVAVPVVLLAPGRVRMLVRVPMLVRMAVGRAVRMRMFVRVLVLVFVAVLGHGASGPGMLAEPAGTGVAGRARTLWPAFTGAMVGIGPMRVPAVRARVLRGEAYGVAFEVRGDDRRLLPLLRARFPPGWTGTRQPAVVVLSVVHEPSEVRRSPRPVTRLSVRLDGRLVARGLSHAQALDVFESELQLSVARLARPEVFVHAGVVAVDGQAILLPGRSGAGKTTLVRALVDAGATYYSDEYAVLDGEGRVHPYARRLSVRMRAGHKERHPVPRTRGRGPVPVGLIVETGYRPDARWRPVPLSAGECVLALLGNTVPARDRPAEVLSVLARATERARGIRSDRGAASRTARTLIALAREVAAGERRPARAGARKHAALARRG